MRPKSFPPAWLLAAGLAVSSGLPMARAVTLHWDGTSTGPNADGGNGTWTASPGPANWTSAATGGVNSNWFEQSDVVFGGTAGTVTISGTVNTRSLDFRTTGYHVTGGVIVFGSVAPVIATGTGNARISSNFNGSAPLSKTGTGTLTLSSANSIYSGAFTISQGTVKVDGAGALGSTTGATIITQGGALDLNGRNVGNEPLRIQGTGADGKGTLVNNHLTDTATVRYLQLTGAATIGGTGRWDIASGSPLFMGGHVLTKVGSGSVYLRNGSISSPGHIDITEGAFWLENSSVLTGSSFNTVTVREGATLGVAGGSNQPDHPWTVLMEKGSRWIAASGPTLHDKASWTGPVDATGDITVEVAEEFTMTQEGPMSSTGSVTKTGEGTWILRSHNDYAGGTIVNGGTLILDPDYNYYDAPPLAGAVTVNAGAILQLAVPVSLGVEGTAGVTSLTINGGLVESTGSFSTDIVSLKLTAGSLRADHFGSFQLRPGASIQTYSAEVPSVISGRLDLGPSSTPVPFQIGGGNTTADLIVDAILSDEGSGRGITKSGEGRMILNGRSFITGPTDVQAGSLLLGVDGSLPASAVTVRAGGRFGTPAPGKTLASLQAEEGSRLILPASAGTTTTITGALDLTSGNITIAPVLGATSATGTYDLATAGSITGSGTPVLNLSSAYGSTRATGSVSVVGNKLQLHLAATGGNLVWNNASAAGAATGTWGTLYEDFSLDGNNTAFKAFDSVTFDDSVAPGSSKTISLGTNLAPALVTVNNSNGIYTFTSSGGLVGGGSLVKTGTSPLFIAGPDSYAMTGDVTAGGGLLDFSGKSISTGKLTVEGGELANATVNAQATDLRSGTVTATLEGDGSWQKTTPGTVLLTAANRLTGPGLVAEGTLLVGDPALPGSTSSLGVGPVHIATGATVTFSRGGDRANFVNSFSGSGALSFTGVNINGTSISDFLILSDNSGYSGDLTIKNARVRVESASQLGSAAVTLTGRVALLVTNTVLQNSLHLAPTGPWGLGTSEEDTVHLHNATLAGPIQLAGGTASRLRGSGPYSVGEAHDNHITGPITEISGPASVLFHGEEHGGSSSLILSGHSHYTGTTTIWGKVKLDGSLGGTAVTVTAGGSLGGTGSIGDGGSLTITGSGQLRSNLTGDSLKVDGNVDVGPAMKVSVDLAQASPTAGPVPILQYTGALSGSIAGVTIDNVSHHRQAVFNFTPGLITLDIGRRTLVWKGPNGSNGFDWEVGGTVRRWKSADTGEDEFFYKGDDVIFDDTFLGGANSSSAMEPSSVLVNNSSGLLRIPAAIKGPCPLIKRGAGKVILQSDNSHTGGTFIEAGTLEAEFDALGNGPVMVSPAGTLVGDTTFPGPLTVQGTLDPGVSWNTYAATITAGSTVLSGTYRCQLSTYGSDRLAVNGDLDITGASLVLDRTYESLQETLDYFTLATWTGNLTGTFASVSGLPGGFDVVYDHSNKRILAKPHDFDRWLEGYPGLSDTTGQGDPDGDGIPNLVEYVLAGNPSVNDSSILPSITFGNYDSVMVTLRRNDTSIYDTLPVLQWATDLAGPWTDYGLYGRTSYAYETFTENGDEPNDITVRLPRQPDKMFIRVKVERR